MASVWGILGDIATLASHAPYAVDPCITGSMYSSNPVCMNTTDGAVGACVAGEHSGLITF